MIVPAAIVVHVDTLHAVNTVRPDRAIGTGVDSDPKGKIGILYSPQRTALMTSTGLGWLTYRLYTELSIEDWHWNPRGTFSAGNEGYWTSSASISTTAITDSFGYRLAHRGSSRDQGDDDDYSRIDDGDPTTYWKSNPYLTERFTHQPDSAHPQWMLVDFGKAQAVDAVRIGWANPYATAYTIEYWAGDGDAVLDQANGSWHPFAGGTVSAGNGGSELVRVHAPINPRFVRIVMRASSNTCDTHGSSDPRNCVGYAIGDLAAGTLDHNGTLVDAIVRAKCGGNPTSQACWPHQTTLFTSSTDPWHAHSDQVKNDQDQPGLDLIARSNITHGLPVMYPVPLFYSTPENAANEVRYLRARHYPIMAIEMGEEVDGQYGMPEDYAELYVQFAAAIRSVDPDVKLGGPVFSGVNKDIAVWPDAGGDASWMHRFVRYLRERDGMRDFNFMSFEHYPFRNCDAGATLQNDLLIEPSLVRSIVDVWHDDGVPRELPLYITEANFSADGTGVPQRSEGALWTADYVASALAAGVAGVMYYQIEPEPLSRSKECGTWGAYNPYLVDDDFTVRAKGAAYYAARLLTSDWLQAGDTPHALFHATSSLGDDKPVVTAYPARRPDGTWSVLFVNKDFVARDVRVSFDGTSRRPQVFRGTLDVRTFGDAQYRWSGEAGIAPRPDRGIERRRIRAARTYRLPARALTVLRGRIGTADIE